MITLGRQFELDLKELETLLYRWSTEAEKELKQALRKIGARTQAEAVMRVPVETSNLKQRILWNLYQQAGDWFVEIGTNVIDYPEYLEFGTEYIASGRVKQLGESALLEDVNAVHNWPAKSGNATELTSVRIDQGGGARGRLRNSKGRFLKSRPQEQMPWLRPAFNKNRAWAIALIDQALAPPLSSQRNAA
jgi:hypothetical protein